MAECHLKECMKFTTFILEMFAQKIISYGCFGTCKSILHLKVFMTQNFCDCSTNLGEKHLMFKAVEIVFTESF